MTNSHTQRHWCVTLLGLSIFDDMAKRRKFIDDKIGTVHSFHSNYLFILYDLSFSIISIPSLHVQGLLIFWVLAYYLCVIHHSVCVIWGKKRKILNFFFSIHLLVSCYNPFGSFKNYKLRKLGKWILFFCPQELFLHFKMSHKIGLGTCPN